MHLNKWTLSNFRRFSKGEVIKTHGSKTEIKSAIKLFYLFKDAKYLNIKLALDQIVSYDRSVWEFTEGKTGARYELLFLLGRPIENVLKALV